MADAKAYMEKHQLEQFLSDAVNEAIKLDSDDPLRVISDYLRQFAKEKDLSDYEDDDDDVIGEHEEPVRPMMSGRRGQVAAKKLEIPEGWAPVTVAKGEAETAFLKDNLASNKLFKKCAADAQPARGRARFTACTPFAGAARTTVH